MDFGKHQSFVFAEHRIAEDERFCLRPTASDISEEYTTSITIALVLFGCLIGILQIIQGPSHLGPVQAQGVLPKYRHDSLQWHPWVPNRL